EGSSFGEPGERPISAAKARGRDPRRPPAARGRTDRRRPMPEGDTIHRTAAVLAPHLVGRQIIAARGRPGGPQVRRIVGATIDAVEAAGKNLLIRFDNGLELRTHMRMNGSWHRYRPGERWRRPESAMTEIGVRCDGDHEAGWVCVVTLRDAGREVSSHRVGVTVADL